MKKLVCLSLVALLAVQTTACGVNAQESDTGNIVVEDIGEAEDKLPERNLKDDRLEQVTESGKLLIGISPDYAPFAFMEDSKDTTKTSAADKETDTTKASVADKETDTTKTSAADNTAQTDDTSTCAGSDVQLGEYIAEQLGVEPLFVEMEFDDCLKAAKEGTVDLVLLGMLPKNDRKASVDFTEEYYKPGKQVLLVKEGKKKREEVRMKKETFCRYIRQYETDMFRFAKSIVGTQADGEDAMQESILKAYENIDTLRSRRKFKAWIFQILANECYQILRNRKRQEPTDPFEFPEQEHSSDYWTEDMVSEDGEILSYILRMPKQHQEVLILYYYDEFSTKEIAKILDIPQGTVKSRLARGRKQLKDLLEMEGEGAYEGA